MDQISKSTTNGITVSVSTLFRQEVSRVAASYFCYSYTITIQNKSNQDVQLLRRHWDIWDSLNELRFVDGEGVIGEQPIISSGEIFIYTSFCDVYSEFGYMQGYFVFANANDPKLFEVQIPRFSLVFEGKMN